MLGHWTFPSSVAAIILVASLSGCGTGDVTGGTSTSMNSDQVTELEKELRAKPSLEAAQAEYKAAVTTMADGIASLIPGTTWQFAQDTWTGCSGTYGAANANGCLQWIHSRCRLAEGITDRLGWCRHGDMTRTGPLEQPVPSRNVRQPATDRTAATRPQRLKPGRHSSIDQLVEFLRRVCGPK